MSAMAGVHWTTSTLTAANGLVPRGVIGIWSGSIDAIPAGWALCNGQNGTPDLRDRFVVGAGNSYSVGATGGSATVSHTHTFSGTTSGGSSSWGIVSITGSAPRGDHVHNYSGTSSATAAENRPPYYALAFIMKL